MLLRRLNDKSVFMTTLSVICIVIFLAIFLENYTNTLNYFENEECTSSTSYELWQNYFTFNSDSSLSYEKNPLTHTFEMTKIKPKIGRCM